MKKLFAFLRSMRFGMLLLALVMLFSFAGSLIPQGEDAMIYVRAYGASAAGLLLRTGLTDVFRSWYFILLLALLCGNLVLCSIVRLPTARKTFARLREEARAAEPDHPLRPGGAERVRDRLRRERFRRDGTVWHKNGAGAYGSFLTHLSILLVLLFGSLALATPSVTDTTVMPGEAIELEGGVRVECLRFRIEDETGRLDYASRLRVTDGKEALEREIRVNEPLRFRGYKIYQQTYGTAGRVRVFNSANGAEETFFLTEPAFLSIDGRNGVYFRALYPGYLKGEDGSYTLITSTSVSYADPVYEVQSVTDGSSASVLAFPGETLTIGDISFTFLAPEEYPGLRIKKTSALLYACLYASFGLAVAALWLCFFAAPVCVRVEETGYAVVSLKPQEGLLLRLEAVADEGGNE